MKIKNILLLMFTANTVAFTQPRIGAQVWIEPGQTSAEIDEWFNILARQNMSVARLFMMWNYIERAPGQYDFSLYDQAFESAAKYGISIEATLTANHGPAFKDVKFWYHDQDGTIPTSDAQYKAASEYILQIINRYKNHPALKTWWLQNEPGQHNAHDTLAIAHFRKWLEKKYVFIDQLNSRWLTHYRSFADIQYNNCWDQPAGFMRPAPYLDWNFFWRDYMTFYLQWLSSEIRKYDNLHPLHVNPHAIFDILPKYDLPAWRTFLSSLGASVHPSWHLNMFAREDYALGISGICDIIRGAIEPKPFWVSELQAGNNIWSGLHPLCPSANDIAQWVWTGIGCGATQVIFWCLNWRRFGSEAGEWSLLGYNNSVSERMLAASQIASVIQNQASLFRDAYPCVSNITLLLSPETMLILARKDNWKDIEGRMAHAHIKAVMACYKAFCEMGISVHLKQMDDYNWSPSEKQILVMAHNVSIPSRFIPKIRSFVEAGNKLIVTGLSGYFDENEYNVWQSHFPLADVFGATVKEVKLMDKEFEIRIDGYAGSFPSHMWVSTLNMGSGKAMAYWNGEPAAVRNTFGKGEVVWVPSMIDLGAWLGNNQSLTAFLDHEAVSSAANVPLRFLHPASHVLMKTLTSGKHYITVITNGAMDYKHIALTGLTDYRALELFNYSCRYDPSGCAVELGPRGTIVLVWAVK